MVLPIGKAPRYPSRWLMPDDITDRCFEVGLGDLCSMRLRMRLCKLFIPVINCLVCDPTRYRRELASDTHR